MRAIAVSICALSVLAVGCSELSPTQPSVVSATTVTTASAPVAGSLSAGARNDKACWGEATQAFARLGEMGIHASQQDEPRLGLRNVARLLYELGALPNDSLQALGAFLSSVLGLSIDSCL